MNPHSVPVGLGPAVDCEQLLTSQEWDAYVSSPSPLTLHRLLAFTERSGLRTCLVPALVGLFNKTLNWKIAQHLAHQCLERRFVALGLYYAQRALDLSNGDTIPRVTIARACWEQRFCEAALYHADLAYAQLGGLPEERRSSFEIELVDLFANIYLYVGDAGRAEPWLRRLLGTSRIHVDTLCAALVMSIQDGDWILAEELSLKLAPCVELLAGRHVTMIQMALRHRLLRLFRGRSP